MTGALVALNVVVFVWELVSGATGATATSDGGLIGAGAIVPALVLQRGEWWRIVTGSFLHGGVAHIAFNMIALWQLGTFIESLAGSRRMLGIYLISMIGAGLAVVFFSSPWVPTVGASGAIYGLFGALIAIGLRMGGRGRGLIASTAPILVINLVLTFTIPFISIAAHLGGLASGFVAALILQRDPALVERERAEAAAVLAPPIAEGAEPPAAEGRVQS